MSKGSTGFFCSIVFICIIFLVSCQNDPPPSPPPSPTPEVTPSSNPSSQRLTEKEAFQMMVVLNYIQLSLAKISFYEDRIILDGEYRNIFDNIKLSVIHDKETLTFLEHVREVFESYLLSDDEREALSRRYDTAVARAFYELCLAVMSSPQDVAQNIAVVGDVYANYRQNIDKYHQHLKESLRKLPGEALNNVNTLQKQFPEMYWTLIEKYNLPDTLRLTEQQIKQFISLLTEKDLQKRLRQFEDIQDRFSALPAFHYQYIRTASQILPQDSILALYKNIEQQNLNIFREDHEYIDMLIEKIVMHYSIQASQRPLNEIEILRETLDTTETLQIIAKSNPNNWRRNIFAALYYLAEDDYDTSQALILRNLDKEKEISLNSRVLGIVYATSNQESRLIELLEQMIDNKQVRYQDLMYLMNIIRSGPFLQKMVRSFVAPILQKISFSIEGLLGADDLIITIPDIWFRYPLDASSLTLTFLDESSTFSPKGNEGKRKKNTNLMKFIFPDRLNAKIFIKSELEKMLQLNISDDVQTSKIFFEARVQKQGKKSEIVFELRGFETGDICYFLIDGNWERGEAACNF